MPSAATGSEKNAHRPTRPGIRNDRSHQRNSCNDPDWIDLLSAGGYPLDQSDPQIYRRHENITDDDHRHRDQSYNRSLVVGDRIQGDR